MARTNTSTSPRIHFLDELRGFSILLMVFYHGFYTFGYIFNVAFARTLFLFFMPVQPLFAAIFIIICGISCRLSHNNLSRGLWLVLMSLVITLAMWLFFPEDIILFGILHFLGVSILLFVLLRPLLDRIPPLVGVLVCAALFLLTYWVPVSEGGMLGIPGLLSYKIPHLDKTPFWLFLFGLHPVYSADYFPLIPWFFALLCGTFLGVWAKAQQYPRWMYQRHVPFFSVVGRFTLWVYLFHQPILYGLGLAVFWLIGLFS